MNIRTICTSDSSPPRHQVMDLRVFFAGKERCEDRHLNNFGLIAPEPILNSCSRRLEHYGWVIQQSPIFQGEPHETVE
jgi:hypothetical protein